MHTLKSFFKTIFGRFVIITLLIIFQIALLIYFGNYFMQYYYFRIAVIVLEVSFLIHIISKDEPSSYKLPWIMVILLFPVGGVIAYLLLGSTLLPRRKIKKIETAKMQMVNKVPKDEKAIQALMEDRLEFSQCNYIYQTTHLNPYSNTLIKYFDSGEGVIDSMIRDMKKAQKYIFIETFIISRGVVWDRIEKILLKKQAEGVEVRIMYDDVGSMKDLSMRFNKKLEKKGLKVCKFMPYLPLISIVHNNRDHRKMTIIDGEVAYTGGFNLADEYANLDSVLGDWKDSGIRLEGDGVNNMIELFLGLWNAYYKNSDGEYTKYFPVRASIPGASGYNQMFGAGPKPIYKENIGENVYLNLINQSADYVYITTPYLIVDRSMTRALTNAARRGVDVRIITPHIPDKKIVFLMTKSSYHHLIESGVKIYEYTPGFMHAKNVISDGKTAVIGTINFDYRSFIHHFECACWIHDMPCISDMTKDFQKTLKVSKMQTLNDSVIKNPFKRLLLVVLKLFAPLM